MFAPTAINPSRMPWAATVRIEALIRLKPSRRRLVNTRSTVSVSSAVCIASPHEKCKRQDGEGAGADEELGHAGKPEARDRGFHDSDHDREGQHPGEEDPGVQE